MGALDMAGHIDSTFKSVDVVLSAYTAGHYDDNGIWQQGVEINETYTANVQPLNDRELNNLLLAGIRTLDVRKVYINSGDLEKLKLAYDINFIGAQWLILQSDIRPWRNYAKLVVNRFDDQDDTDPQNANIVEGS